MDGSSIRAHRSAAGAAGLEKQKTGPAKPVRPRPGRAIPAEALARSLSCDRPAGGPHWARAGDRGGRRTESLSFVDVDGHGPVGGEPDADARDACRGDQGVHYPRIRAWLRRRAGSRRSSQPQRPAPRAARRAKYRAATRWSVLHRLAQGLPPCRDTIREARTHSSGVPLAHDPKKKAIVSGSSIRTEPSGTGIPASGGAHGFSGHWTAGPSRDWRPSREEHGQACPCRVITGDQRAEVSAKSSDWRRRATEGQFAGPAQRTPGAYSPMSSGPAPSAADEAAPGARGRPAARGGTSRHPPATRPGPASGVAALIEQDRCGQPGRGLDYAGWGRPKADGDRDPADRGAVRGRSSVPYTTRFGLHLQARGVRTRW